MIRIITALLGGFIGALIPLSALLVRAYHARQSWWTRWLKSEFDRNGEIYVAVGISCIILLTLVGYFLGRRFDDLEEEALEIQDSNMELSHMAATDSLTGLFNGRTMDEHMDIELGNAHRWPLSILSIDIDHFKQINDKHGHPFGDEVLVRIAAILKHCVRRVDAVGRLGGEEFMILLPETPLDHAEKIANRIRESVHSERFEMDGKRVKVTVSVGVADSHQAGLEEKMALIKAADDSLYAAKNAGRNKTVVYKPA